MSFKLWVALIGLVLIGLISPFWAGSANAVVGLYSDPVNQIIIMAMLPAFVFLYFFVQLFTRRQE